MITSYWLGRLAQQTRDAATGALLNGSDTMPLLEEAVEGATYNAIFEVGSSVPQIDSISLMAGDNAITSDAVDIPNNGYVRVRHVIIYKEAVS